MTTSYYDVVILGTQLAPLLAGALLAKRGFRVLLIGQDERLPTYEALERSLPRAPFNLLTAHSPMARRVLSELALHQLLRRHATARDPAMQIAMPGHRFELAAEQSVLDREIEREFPEVKRPVEDFLKRVRTNSAALDRLIERDLTWPPEGFLERRELARLSAGQPFGKAGDSLDPLREFPEEHPFRIAVHAPTRFADGMDPDHTHGLRLTRLFAAWLDGGAELDGGYETLRRLLVDSIGTHSGDVRQGEKADAILIRRGTASGIRLAASGDEVGASFVIVGSDLVRLLRLLPDRAPFEELFERIGEPVARYFRYTLNLVVAAEGVPIGMAREVFHVRDPRRPLSGENMLHVQADPPGPDGSRLLCVEALLPRRGIEDVTGYTETVRERLVASLGELVPFLGKRLLLMDSPHDGRDIQDLSRGVTVPAPDPWARGPSTMPVVYGYPVTTALGVCAMPVQTPVRRLLMCNSQVVPGLGTEGLFLAGWSAARVITRTDRKKAWMRRGRWGKLEV